MLEEVSDLTTEKLVYNGYIHYEEGDIPFINKKSYGMTYEAEVKAGIDMNEIKVYDITGPKKPVVSGKTKPVIAELHKEYLPKDGVKITINKKETVQKKTQTAAGNDAAPGAK